jgi:hypothetical protein
MTHSFFRRFAFATVLAAACGCTPNEYRRQADAQVGRLIRQRAEATLGYDPTVLPAATPATRPSRKDYAKLPTSPIPPVLPPAIAPVPYTVPYGPIGPEQLFGDGQPAIMFDDLGADLALQSSGDRLRLGPPVPGRVGRTFELFAALRYALENSRTYRSRVEDLYLAALDVTLERHLFSPRPFARTSAVYSGGQLDADYRSALTVANAVGVRQQLPYGGEIVAQALVDFVQAVNDNSQSGENASLVLSGSIPLLRGAGMVNLEPLIDSERSLVYAVRDFEEFRRGFVVDVASAYFSLVNTRSRINNSLISFVNATNLVLRVEELYAAGRVNFLQVQQARQQRLSNENSLVQAQEDYQNALDDFKLLIGMPVEEPLEIVGVELEVPVPAVEQTDFVDLAFRYRLTLQTARDQIDDARRSVAVASNGLLPELNLTARGEIGNRNIGAPASAIDSRDLTYSAGIELDLPVDRLRERNEYRAALIRFERSQRNYVTTRDSVAADVRTSARAVESALITLSIQRRSIDLAQRRLDYSNELLIQGKAQARDVTEALTSLLNAQNNFDRARADLQIQILRLLRSSGLLRIDPSAGELGSVLTGPNSPRPPDSETIIRSLR